MAQAFPDPYSGLAQGIESGVRLGLGIQQFKQQKQEIAETKKYRAFQKRMSLFTVGAKALESKPAFLRGKAMGNLINEVFGDELKGVGDAFNNLDTDGQAAVADILKTIGTKKGKPIAEELIKLKVWDVPNDVIDYIAEQHGEETESLKTKKIGRLANRILSLNSQKQKGDVVVIPRDMTTDSPLLDESGQVVEMTADDRISELLAELSEKDPDRATAIRKEITRFETLRKEERIKERVKAPSRTKTIENKWLSQFDKRFGKPTINAAGLTIYLPDPEKKAEMWQTFEKQRPRLDRQGFDTSHIETLLIATWGEKDAPIPTPEGAGAITEGATATNPTTGEKRIYRNGAWQPM